MLETGIALALVDTRGYVSASSLSASSDDEAAASMVAPRRRQFRPRISRRAHPWSRPGLSEPGQTATEHAVGRLCIPHTDAEMARDAGLPRSLFPGQLFDVVPEALRLAEASSFPTVGPNLTAHFLEGWPRPIGLGRDRLVASPAVGPTTMRSLVTRPWPSRSEFVTSYTPYQPEVAQGVLQAVFEFQTLVARLSGLPVANASLYDGAAATVEALNLGMAASGRQAGLALRAAHPPGGQMMAHLGPGPVTGSSTSHW